MIYRVGEYVLVNLICEILFSLTLNLISRSVKYKVALVLLTFTLLQRLEPFSMMYGRAISWSRYWCAARRWVCVRWTAGRRVSSTRARRSSGCARRSASRPTCRSSSTSRPTSRFWLRASPRARGRASRVRPSPMAMASSCPARRAPSRRTATSSPLSHSPAAGASPTLGSGRWAALSRISRFVLCFCVYSRSRLFLAFASRITSICTVHHTPYTAH